MKTLFSRCISLHYFQNATKAGVCVCYVRYYVDHECSSRRVQLSRRDTVNVGWSPGCWIMDQRRTPAQPNAVWSDVTVISTDWCGPQRADSPAIGWSTTHQETPNTLSSNACTQRDSWAFLINCWPLHTTKTCPTNAIEMSTVSKRSI